MIEEFAVRYPALTFGHAYPGIVRTGYGVSANSPLWWKIGYKAATGIIYPFMVSPKDCSEYLLHGVLETMKSPGAYRISNVGVDIDLEMKKKGKEWRALEEDRKALWEHTVEVTKMKEI
ncbi:hypothetical protein D9758_008693 [Tetrapyrgos nigripes]|uniref:Uncharacterized protein n=1 Tax=Tetrapyrgos nigripes TaxID=182062 RepID=A0A8H5D6R0_9AGAR|nr:hypothetical protein D9758_008693 [Tetrapyrgos nigripes]